MTPPSLSRCRPGRPAWMHRHPGRALLLAGLLAWPLQAPTPVRAESGMGAIVRAFCLTAFQSEMSQAGKRPPEGMANFACGCVADRIEAGGSLDAARRDCRELTARRYPI
ncbi:MAG: hypothetical protein VKJ44_01570 [Synechococcus sp.]|nr:hypothetical protein [Synechococcus sp.]